MSHAPTPWAVSHNADSSANVFSLDGDVDCNIRPADAAHIVRCVNAHDELVALLREVPRALTNARRPEWDEQDFENRIRAALAKVEGAQ